MCILLEGESPGKALTGCALPVCAGMVAYTKIRSSLRVNVPVCCDMQNVGFDCVYIACVYCGACEEVGHDG